MCGEVKGLGAASKWGCSVRVSPCTSAAHSRHSLENVKCCVWLVRKVANDGDEEEEPLRARRWRYAKR